MDVTYSATRRSLHACAELLLAGPRFRETGRLRLRVGPRGFRTWDEPYVAQEAGELVTDRIRVALDGLTFERVGVLAGLDVSRLDDVYGDGPKVEPSETIRLDPASVGTVESALELGDRALRAFWPEAEPVLWPEHFDVAITAREVNYGVSPGDAYSSVPYAYVGPHHPVAGEFWNTPFGAAHSLSALRDVAGTVAFFREGARLLGTEPPDRQ
jgi:hypothetical protein